MSLRAKIYGEDVRLAEAHRQARARGALNQIDANARLCVAHYSTPGVAVELARCVGMRGPQKLRARERVCCVVC